MRAWIEAGFKDFKRGGWRCEQTKMTRPQRAERLWLVMTVAMLWAVSVGGEAHLNLTPSPLAALPVPRRLSCCVIRLYRILGAHGFHQPLPRGRFFPEPWPNAPA